VLLALLVLAGLGGLGAAAYWALAAGAPEVEASVVQTPTGEALRVRVPEAEAGTKVRFEGNETALEAGEARFPLASDSLGVGDNEIVVDIVGADGEVTEVPITLTLEYRAYPVLDGLGDDPPTLRIVFEAQPGSEVTVEGTPLPLDGQGQGARSVPLEGSADGPEAAVERSVRYAITLPDGESDQGRVRVRVPYATLQIDRPGDEVVTDEDHIEIAGAVHPSAEVTVDGERVPLRDDHFFYRYPLPNAGSYEPEVVARRPGRIPRRRSLRIQRVEDLEREARRFRADADLDYARLEQNPNIYKGRKVRMVGRVYNVQVSKGEAVLQMLVRDCAADRRCPLWVTFPAGLDVKNNSWVRVYGEVVGEQQFRAKSDKVISVPRVDASFVLPGKG
jgi:hypothetical protein